MFTTDQPYFPFNLRGIAERLLELTTPGNIRDLMEAAGKHQDVDLVPAMVIPDHLKKIHRAVDRYLNGTVGVDANNTARKLGGYAFELRRQTEELKSSADPEMVSEVPARDPDSIADLMMSSPVDRLNHIASGCSIFFTMATSQSQDKGLY